MTAKHADPALARQAEYAADLEHRQHYTPEQAARLAKIVYPTAAQRRMAHARRSRNGNGKQQS